MKLNFALPVIDLKGKEIVEQGKTIPTLMSEILSYQLAVDMQSKHPQKFIHWAEKLADNGMLDLDNEDKKILEDFLKRVNLPALTVARMLDVLDKKEN